MFGFGKKNRFNKLMYEALLNGDDYTTIHQTSPLPPSNKANPSATSEKNIAEAMLLFGEAPAHIARELSNRYRLN